MKIAVTGATGFIGRHLVSELRRRALRPTIVIRPTSKAPDCWLDLPIVRMDLQNPPADAFELLGSPEVLIHLAWDGLPNYKSPHHLERELPAQDRLLKSLIDSGLENIVVTGTCLEYGLTSGKLTEDLETDPTTAYGMAKDTLRRRLQTLKQSTAFSLTWARLFYVYGDGQAESSLLPQLKQAVDRGDEFFNMSGGEQQRDYLPVDHAVKALVSLAVGKRDNGVVNVCSGEPITVRDLVQGWIDSNGWAIKLNLGYYPYPDYEPMAFWGDRTKLEDCLAS